MKVSFVETGLFKLDGGAMFGVVPKSMWKRLNPPDENNMCTWAMRALLIETDDRKILVDTGLGAKQDAKFRSHFEPHGEDSLVNSLSKNSLSTDDITDVFLTHLHFDHVGGAVSITEEGHHYPTFSNARYWSNELHYKWALDPNPREKASFLKENFVPLQGAGVLDFVDVKSTKNVFEWLPGIGIQLVYGHTEAMMLLHLSVNGKKMIYCADLIPSSFHIGLPYVMSYDIRPLEAIKEKKALLNLAIEESALLLFEHDPINGSCTIKENDRGRIVLDQYMSIEDYLNS